MAAVTQRIPNYLGGVSRQPDDKKLPGQVVDVINGYPDVALGLTKRPGIQHITNLGTGTTYDNCKWFYIHRDNDERYIGCITPASGGNPGDIDIWNAVTGVACTVNYGTGAQAYLSGTRNDYDVLTVQDTSIITNKTVTVGTQTAVAHTADLKATVVLVDVAYSAEYKVEVTVSGTTYTATYTSPANASSAANTTLGVTADEILSGIQSALTGQSIPNLTITKLGTVLELANTSAMEITATGGAATNKLTAFVETVDNVSELANEANHGRVAKIVNTTSAFDTYYAKFVAYNGSSGKGYWEETLGFGASPGLDNATMPHELVNSATNTFTFQRIDYTDRLVGDDDTNSHPSFVGNTIQQAFLNANRLGFLTADNVSMSQAGDFYNFYHVSAQTVIDSDPVDISCSSIRPAVLHGVISTTQGLVLFSRSQQFLLTAVDNIMTPRTATIRTISAYEMDTNVDPVDVGTNINFISKTSSFTRVFSMVTRGQQDNPQVLDLSKIVNEYIPSNIDTLIASPQNQFIAMSSQSSDKMYLFSFYNNGEKNLLESWYSWEMPGNVQTCAVDQDDMYVITKQADQFTLGKAAINQSPDTAIIVNSNGARVNPSVDLYATASSVVYDSTDELSKCYLPYNDVPGLKPVLLIAGSTQQGSFVESGFTITPERDSDSTGDYFIVPKKDLTSQASDVIVGFKYDFEVELPTTFYARTPDGKNVDFTARLTIARYTFSVGLSGVMSFKLKSNGSHPQSVSFTGDGSTTNFEFQLDYQDREQIKVKVNGVEDTSFTFVDDNEIQIPSAPEDGHEVLIYLDEWYQLSPVTNANYYLANDIPLTDQQYVTLPIHQNNKNFTLKLFNDSPFPVSVGSMMWEGNYSPRYYRRS
tara:strand:- start:2207 stop:4828 length:2622 start_codon:yes stop_codon:yes gene_type:complete